MPPHQVVRRDAVAEVVGVALHPMHRVTMTNEEVVQPEPIGGRGLAETEHLHLEKGPLGADEVLEGFEDGQVESFGVDLDEAKPWDEVGGVPCEEGLHVPSLDPDLERDRKSTRLNSSHGSISYA